MLTACSIFAVEERLQLWKYKRRLETNIVTNNQNNLRVSKGTLAVSALRHRIPLEAGLFKGKLIETLRKTVIQIYCQSVLSSLLLLLQKQNIHFNSVYLFLKGLRNIKELGVCAH
jgi:hypothetical protein